MYFIENEHYKLEITDLGAELKSIYNKNKKIELLYDGKSEFWNRSSPVLFPIVGRLKDNSYFYNNNEYKLNQHGFARDLYFKLKSNKSDEISFVINSCKETLEKFPFEFDLIIKYKLIKNEIIVSYEVINLSKDVMFFSIGAHPAFNLPLYNNEFFEDYYIEFPEDNSLERFYIDKSNGLFNGNSEIIELDKNKLNLNYLLFENDALVFKKVKSKFIFLKNINQSYKLLLNIKDFPFLGIWTKKNAPFICIEPWQGLADSIFHNKNIKNKEGILCINPNCSNIFEYSIKF